MLKENLYKPSGLMVGDSVKVSSTHIYDFYGKVVHIKYDDVSYFDKNITEYIFLSLDPKIYKDLLKRGSSIYTLNGHYIIDTYIDNEHDISIFSNKNLYIPYIFKIKIDDIMGVLVWREGFNIYKIDE